jgi:hypothetical protein
MLTDRPIFSFSSCHDLIEIYNISTFLMSSFPNYYVEWHMENAVTTTFFAIALFGAPIQPREM